MKKRTGKIIFLNGTSSSGKTTIAKELQQVLLFPYLHVSVDSFLEQLAPSFLNEEKLSSEFSYLLNGFHASIAAICRAGNFIIVDHVLQEPSWADRCIETLAGLHVVFVGVYCPLKELEKREKSRGDREPGLAKYQFERVHSHGIYDVEVDTSAMTVSECVSKICDFINSGKTPSAFERILNKSSEK